MIDHSQNLSAQELVKKFQAFEISLLAPTCLVYPSQVRADFPDTAQQLLVFDTPYYRLTLDDRANVDADFASTWGELEAAMIACALTSQRESIPYSVTDTDQQGYALRLSFKDPSFPLLYTRLRDGIFYVDLVEYFNRNPS